MDIVIELRPKRPQTKMATIKTATSQTKTATLKIQIGHKPKRLLPKWPHDMVTRTANNCFLTALSLACRQIYFFLLLQLITIRISLRF